MMYLKLIVMYLHIAASSLASAYRQTTVINDKLLPFTLRKLKTNI